MARNSKLPPDPALPREEKEPIPWVRNLQNRLTAVLRQMTDQVNLLLDGYLLTVAALPTIGPEHRGRLIVLVGGAGVIDKLYWARKKADDSYEWIEIVP